MLRDRYHIDRVWIVPWITHTMFVNIKSYYYPLRKSHMKWNIRCEIRNYKVYASNSRWTVTTSCNSNIVEPLLFISSSQNWSTLLSHHCSRQYEQISCDLSLVLILFSVLRQRLCWWCMMSETVTVQFDMKLDDILLYWRQTTTFFIKKNYL